MTTILQLNASLSPQGQSDQLANRLVAALLAKQPDAKLTGAIWRLSRCRIWMRLRSGRFHAG